MFYTPINDTADQAVKTNKAINAVIEAIDDARVTFTDNLLRYNKIEAIYEEIKKTENRLEDIWLEIEDFEKEIR